MIITRANPLGGRPLQGYTIHEDPDSGHMGFKLGYCPHGEPLIIRIGDARDIANKLGDHVIEFQRRIYEEGSRIPIRHKFIHWLGGKVV